MLIVRCNLNILELILYVLLSKNKSIFNIVIEVLEQILLFWPMVCGAAPAMVAASHHIHARPVETPCIVVFRLDVMLIE